MLLLKHFYDPDPPALRVAEAKADGKTLVVEIGPGERPFSKANEFVDMGVIPSSVQARHAIDINRQSLPYADKQVDFLYCRHTLEDIYNPYFAIQEISRVAKAGYLETPFPIIECCRGADGFGKHPWRGYNHHRNMLWMKDGKLMIYPKRCLIEHLPFGLADDQIVTLLNQGPHFWNTDCFWDGSIECLDLCDPSRPESQIGYLDMCFKAINESIESITQYARSFPQVP